MSEATTKPVCWVCDGMNSAECPRCRSKAEAKAVEIDAAEQVAGWMIDNGFATGHGGALQDLLRELTWQVKELRQEGAK
jgi:hypothetical protein